jgi:hypothetical protein
MADAVASSSSTVDNSPASSGSTSSSTTLAADDHILTQDDFSGFGLKHRDMSAAAEATFRVRISSEQPIYTFHVMSFTTSTQGAIEVFRGNASSTPVQTIALDPNMWNSDSVALFFNVRDINFDGYADIGVVVEGGALWGSYQYWVFDPKTGLFTTAPVTDDFRNISFNWITFDSSQKQIRTTNLLGAVGWIRSVYQYEDGHLRLLDEVQEENKAPEDWKPKTPDDKPPLTCQVVHNPAQDVPDIQTTITTLPRECDPVPGMN